MRNQPVALLVTLLGLLSPMAAMAQTGADKRTAGVSRAPGETEPLRVISGEMRGRTVTGRVKQGTRVAEFSFTITKADMVNGRPRLTGDFTLGDARARGDLVTATIGGVMAKAANPWPSARDEKRSETKKSKEAEKKAGEQQQGRETQKPEATGQLGQLAQSTQDTARKTPPAPGEKTEQTQSLYAQAEADTGCEVMFLSLSLPQRVRARIGRVAEPLQLGVVLKPFDNERGKEINKAICRLLESQGGRAQSTSLSQLNRLLVSSN